MAQLVSVIDNRILGKIQIVKKDATSGKTLKGATFEVTGPNGYKESVTTNEKGEANLDNLVWGTYIVKETKAPVGYELNNTPQQIVVTKDSVGNVQTTTFKDTRVLGNLNITKIGNKGDKLEGAVFTITGAKGSKEIITNKDGIANLNGLAWGVYTIKETKAPIGYALNPEIKTVIIDANDAQTVQHISVTDNRILGKIQIIKEDAISGGFLKGATFEVTGSNNFKKIVTTNEKGEAELGNLEWGTYTVKETKAPVGYELNNTPQQIVVSKESVGNVQKVVFKDTRVLGSINITKIGNEGNKLEGAIFTIAGPNNYSKEVSTNKEGTITLKDLPWGAYTIKETKAPIGYTLNPKTETVTIDANDTQAVQHISVVDNRILGKIQIIKEDNTSGSKLAGAKFQVTGPNGYDETVTTNKVGVAELDNLAWGTYTIKETKAPVGYELNNTPQQIVVSKESVGNVQTTTFKDNRILGSLNIIKVGNDGKKLEGAEFTIAGPNGYSKNVTTNSNGVASLNDLSWGTYTIKEVKAPNGYELNKQVFTININGENATQQQQITIKDNLIPTTATNNKENNNGGTGNKGNSGSNTNSEDSPQTGDSSELPIYALLALALVGLGINTRRKNKDEKIAK